MDKPLDLSEARRAVGRDLTRHEAGSILFDHRRAPTRVGPLYSWARCRAGMPRVAESVIVDYFDFCTGAGQESRALGSCSFCGALACNWHAVQPTIIRQNLEPCRPPQVIVGQQGMAVLLPGSRGFCIFCGEQMVDQEKALHQCYVIRDVKHRMAEAEGKPECHWCESADVAPIMYGLPTDRGWKHMAETGSIWGGCCVSGHGPRWFCRSCHRMWGRPHEDESFYCAVCGRPSKNSWCSSCQEDANEDAEMILTEASKLAEKMTIERKARAILMTFLILGGASNGEQFP